MNDGLKSTERHYSLFVQEMSMLDVNSPLRVLEIGAGSKIIEKFIPRKWRFDTHDIAGEFWKDSYTYDFDLNDDKFPIKSGIYDIVLCYETLEHVMYPEKVISEIMRISKKDALFFFSLPNEYNFLMRFYYLIGKKTEVDEPFKVVEKSLHIHKPRVSDILDLFGRYFKVEKIDYVWQSRKSENSKFFKKIDRGINLLGSFYPSLFCRCVSVKCVRK